MFPLKKGIKVHIFPDAKIHVILLFDRANMRVTSFFAKWTCLRP
jgi:hypothetical protein